MRRLHVVLIAALLILPACRESGATPLPGDEIGRYGVEASLTDTECGEGHPAPASLSFYVDLFHLEGSSRGYWKLPDGPQIEGVLDRSAGFRFSTTTQAVAWDPDPAAELLGCALDRTEIVEGVLADGPGTEVDGGMEAGEPEARFTGTTRVRLSATPGGDCRALLSVYGGPFPDLPCVIEYALTGERVGAPTSTP